MLLALLAPQPLAPHMLETAPHSGGEPEEEGCVLAAFPSGLPVNCTPTGECPPHVRGEDTLVASRASTVVALCTVFLTSRRRKCSYPRRMSTPTDSTVTVLIVRCVFVLHREGDAES